MKTLHELITEALQSLDKISNHPDFVHLVNLQIWDDPAILLSDASQLLQDFQKIHNDYKSTEKLANLAIWQEITHG